MFIAVRPQTFYKSKQTGPLTAYAHRVFTIAPPRVDQVIEKRLTFALDMAEGRVPIERLENIKLQLVNIVTFLKALRYSLTNNPALLSFFNITAGNIRAVVELLQSLLGCECAMLERSSRSWKKERLLNPFTNLESSIACEYYTMTRNLHLSNLFDIGNANR